MGEDFTGGRFVTVSPEASRRILTEWLFLKTVADVEQRLLSEDRYTVLGLAPLLRKLFVDAEPLLQAVRRNRQQPAVGFHLNPFVPATQVEGQPGWRIALQFGRDELVGGANSPRRSPKQFMSAPVASWRGVALTVREIVKHYSNIEGGVHLGLPERDFSDVLLAIFPPLYDQVPDPVRILIPLAQVAAEGLRELRDDIVAAPFRE
ncbi:hypothetical protein DEJ25_09745 [Curtobacterium sp. MCPF17_011]|uniref:hypothetical protein n=1 Tax=Curtobacterium sp. MCPF17_011 TaxID=2175652 RepID=UPI000DA7666B|nr:hypothetical protein [Curtobacterium sp. MCPF17_011]PZF12100.1 hypothetical protein DEJ25_09745 [Curtobacterium sp. MCPF17_011]